MATVNHLPTDSPTRCYVECFQLRNCKGCFEELVARFQPPVLHYLIQRLGSRQDAEDVFQEVFLIVYRKICTFNLNLEFKTWLFTIATRAAITHHRRQNPAERAMPDRQPSSDPHAIMDEGEQRSRLWDAVRELLAPDHFTAVWLHYVEGMTAEEIGRVLGRNANAVRIILHRARAKLAENLTGTNEKASHGK